MVDFLRKAIPWFAGADDDDAEAAASDAAVPSTSGQDVAAYGGVTEDAGVRMGRTKKSRVAPAAENGVKAARGKKGSHPITGTHGLPWLTHG